MNEELKKILESFCRLEGVRCAMVLDRQGQMIESQNEPPQMAADIAARCLAAGKKMATRLHKETVSHSYVEFKQFSLVAEVLDSDSSLVIVTDPAANLGRLRLEIRKNRKAIDGLLPA